LPRVKTGRRATKRQRAMSTISERRMFLHNSGTPRRTGTSQRNVIVEPRNSSPSQTASENRSNSSICSTFGASIVEATTSRQPKVYGCPRPRYR
jgi:hypothetical protein